MCVVWRGGVSPPAQTQSCDRTWPYLIKARRSLPNNWAIKDYFYPHYRGTVGGRGGEGVGWVERGGVCVSEGGGGWVGCLCEERK